MDETLPKVKLTVLTRRGNSARACVNRTGWTDIYDKVSIRSKNPSVMT